jgi:hypothetical protein
MTSYTRTIGRQITNAYPQWRVDMEVTNTLYEVGDAPTVLTGKIVWPAAGANNFQFNGGGDGNSVYLHAAYGGSVYVSELGAYGAMVFGRTGEATIDSQLSTFTLSDNAPTWNMFQQPTYPISEAQAASMNADWFYGASIGTTDLGGPVQNLTTEAQFTNGTWLGGFPVNYGNWSIRRKYANGGITGAPHFFRYNMPRYVSSAMTGTGVGAIVVNQRGTIYGPFSQGPMPAGEATASKWYADVWPSGRTKYYLWAMNVQTKAWTRLTDPVPDFTGYGSDLSTPHACVDEANKRIYYSAYNGSSHALYYADFDSGLGSVTLTNPANATDLAGGPAPSQSGNSVLCVPISGANSGRRLWYMKDQNATPSLLLWDIDNNVLRRLSPSGLPANADWWGFSYRASTNEVLISTRSTTNGVRSYRFTIPTDPTVTGNYSVSMTQIALNGIPLEAAGDAAPWLYGERTKYLDSLGVILLTQRYGKMLAYRPA